MHKHSDWTLQRLELISVSTIAAGIITNFLIIDGSSAKAYETSQSHVSVKRDNLGEFLVHPLLGTYQGKDLGHKWLSSEDFKQLARLQFDANYIRHLKAESDAVDRLCKLVKARKFDPILFDEINYFANVKGGLKQLTLVKSFGYNEIPVEITYEDGSCKNFKKLTKEHFLAGRKSKMLSHPVLKAREYTGLQGRPLEGFTFRALMTVVPVESREVKRYVGASKCFRLQESQAALQFRNRVIGLSENEVLAMVGPPVVTLDRVSFWSRGTEACEDWVYFLGYENIPVRLVVKNKECIGAFVLSTKETQDFSSWRCLKFENIKGKSTSEVLEKAGSPEKISLNCSGSTVYKYPVSRSSFVELTIADGRCTAADATLRSSW